jgi:poly(A) polymerase
MALSRERIADELLKLLSVDEPVATVRVMLERKILNPVLPEIGETAWAALDALIRAEIEAAIEGEPLRRLAALLPRNPEIAAAVTARLKLSNRARKRVACAVEPARHDPYETAYRLSTECAVDRLLLAGRPQEARTIEQWSPPRLPVTGGALIKRGLTEGPDVSRTLRHIEDRWIESGFPGGSELEAIVSDALAANSR